MMFYFVVGLLQIWRASQVWGGKALRIREAGDPSRGRPLVCRSFRSNIKKWAEGYCFIGRNKKLIQLQKGSTHTRAQKKDLGQNCLRRRKAIDFGKTESMGLLLIEDTYISWKGFSSHRWEDL